MPKKEKKPILNEEPEKELKADDLEKVTGGVKINPDAKITPIVPKTEIQTIKDPEKTASANGDITLPEIP